MQTCRIGASKHAGANSNFLATGAMPIVSHADKENAGSGEGAPEKKKWVGLTAVDFNELTMEQRAEFLNVLLAKDDGEAQVTALGLELKEISKDSTDTLAESEKTAKAIKAKMAELQKEATRARETGNSALSTFETTKVSLAIVDGTIMRKKEADQRAVEIKKLEEQLAAVEAETARAKEKLAASQSEAAEQKRLNQAAAAAGAAFMAALEAGRSASGARSSA